MARPIEISLVDLQGKKMAGVQKHQKICVLRQIHRIRPNGHIVLQQVVSLVQGDDPAGLS
jgi:hypothetical protein